MRISVDITHGNAGDAWDNFINWCFINCKEDSDWVSFMERQRQKYKYYFNYTTALIEFETPEDASLFLLSWS